MRSIFHHIMCTCCVPYARLSYICSYVPTATYSYVAQTHAARVIYSINIQCFVSRISYTLWLRITLDNFQSEDGKICQILFRQYEFCNKFAKFSCHQSFLPYGNHMNKCHDTCTGQPVLENGSAKFHIVNFHHFQFADSIL